MLSFYAGIFGWTSAEYEPPVKAGTNKKNPEASFKGTLSCKVAGKEEFEQEVIVNIEVKSPKFPHDMHADEKIAIPTVLLTKEGREKVRSFCEAYGVKYLDPRVMKLKDFINSAAGKFAEPNEKEFNLLYINWSYRDFPSNSFLEPWALLTNDVNGLLTCPKYGKSIGVVPEAYDRISAVIVYTESLEGLMFSDYRYVWQRNGAGPKFRMWVVNEKLRNAELADQSNSLRSVIGMNPSVASKQRVMVDLKSQNGLERIMGERFTMDLAHLIALNTDS